MGLQSRSIKSQRILEVTVTADVSDNTFLATAVKLQRDGVAGEYLDVVFTTAAGNPAYIELGEAIPAGTILVVRGTIQA